MGEVRGPLVGLAAVLLGACAAPGPVRPTLTEAELLAGAPLPSAVDAAPPITAAEATELDTDMRTFVAKSVGPATDPHYKLERLFDGMRRDGLFRLVYSGIETRPATVTFRERRGNCLSFTMMFVALAREAGLAVKYQVVDVPPQWTSDNELVVVRSHINAVVRTGYDRTTLVDFNLFDAKAKYSRRSVDDAYVLGLFYANVGAEALIDKDYELAFRYLRESARAAPELPAAWINLGALYSRLHAYDYAESAYLRALAAVPNNPSAATNLVRLYTTLGEDALAEVYRQRVRHYQDANPYYHYALAQRFYEDGSFDAALGELRRAQRLKRDEQDFYLLQARALLELGRLDAAADALDRGREYAQPADARAEYDAQAEAVLSGRVTPAPEPVLPEQAANADQAH
ncbi:MAG TPA: transglutaminase domain-containing protein [Gammaproteobacteria bacterium]|nr:transglutaminase domain-containing protein [Gammaproteobacteria bacterium]